MSAKFVKFKRQDGEEWYLNLANVADIGTVGELPPQGAVTRNEQPLVSHGAVITYLGGQTAVLGPESWQRLKAIVETLE